MLGHEPKTPFRESLERWLFAVRRRIGGTSASTVIPPKCVFVNL